MQSSRQIGPEGQARPGPRILLTQRLVQVPARPRELLQQRVQLGRQCRGGHSAGEYVHPSPTAATGLCGQLEDRSGEIVPGRDLASMPHRLRPVRVPELQNRCLREDVRGAQGRRVLGISFNLGGPSHVAIHPPSLCVAIASQRRREESWQLITLSARRVNVRNDLGLWWATAGCHPRERERRAQRAQELSPIQAEHLRKTRLLLLQPAPEGLAVGELLEAAPQHRARLGRQLGTRRRRIERLLTSQRWHTEQSVRRAVSMWYAFSSRAPNAAWSAAFQ